jgi:mono/diheme cytochrome c family protein
MVNRMIFQCRVRSRVTNYSASFFTIVTLLASGLPVFAGAHSDACAGADAQGSPQGPSLVNGPRAHGDGSLPSITQIIASGVPKPRNFPGAMPPNGGVPLSDSEVAAVAAYVWAIGHFEGGRGKPITNAR